MPETDDNSRQAFVADQVARSFDAREWLYQFPDLVASLGERFRDAEELGELHDRIRSWIESDVTLRIPGGKHPPDDVRFDARLGWVIGAGGEKGYLGKLVATGRPLITLGRMSYFSGPSLVRGSGPLSVGMFSCLAEGLAISTESEDHPYEYPAVINWAENRRLVEEGRTLPIDYGGPDAPGGVRIGNDVWIGRDVTIQPGAEIGDGCVVAQGSLVRGQLDPYGIYAGWPATRKKDRFPEAEAQRLQELKWWEWPWDRIAAEREFFGRRVGEEL